METFYWKYLRFVLTCRPLIIVVPLLQLLDQKVGFLKMHQGTIVISKANLDMEGRGNVFMGMNFVSSQENLNVQMVGHFYKGTVSKMLNQKVLP